MPPATRDSTTAVSSQANTLHDGASEKSVSENGEPSNRSSRADLEASPNTDNEKPAPPGGAQAEAEANIVGWDGPDDPLNPQLWSFGRKCWTTAISALMTFAVSFGSSVFSSTTRVLAAEFGVSNVVMILGVSLYVLGFACGPLIWGPLSEAYGRRKPLMIGFLGFIIFQIPIGVANNLHTIMICRFFGGAFGSAPIGIVAGMFVDFWDTVSRSIATMGYAAAVFAGPAMGPIVGEFTVKNPSLGWRWTAWFTMIMSAFFFVLALPTVAETSAPIIHQKKAARLRFETGNWALHAKKDEDPVNAKAMFVKYGLKPAKMIIAEPILVIFTIYMSLMYGILYLCFFAYPISFEYDRGMISGVAALPFLGIFIGVLLACALMAAETVYVFQPKLQKAKKLIPEERLPPMMAGSIIIVIGLFWFSWTSYPSISPWPQIISGVFIGCGFVMVFMAGVIYLVDVYLFDANSALAINSLIRSGVAAGFPLFTTAMYNELGIQWATSLLAFLCVALAPAPFLFYIYGQRVRSWSKFAYDFG